MTPEHPVSRPRRPLRRLLAAGLAAALAAAVAGGAYWGNQARMAPSGKLYVADTFADDVGVINIATGQKIKLLQAGKLPHNLALTRDRKRLFVTESGSQSVTAYDTLRDEPILQKIVGPVPDNEHHRKIGMDQVKSAPSCKECHWQRSVGSFISGVTLSPDESELWITEMKTQKVTIVDARTLETRRQVEVLNPDGTTPSNVLIHPQTREVYVLSRARPGGKTLTAAAAANAGFDHDAAKGTSYVTVYDPAFKAVRGRVQVPFAVPFGGVFSPDGSELYVTYRSTDKIAVIDTVKLTHARSYDVDEAPIGILLAPDARTLMVANFYQTPATVQFLDRETGRVKHELEVPSSPTLMVRHPANGLVYLTASGSNKIVEIDPRVPEVKRVFEAGAYPIDIQLVP